MAVRIPAGLQAIGQNVVGTPGYQPNYHQLITHNYAYGQTAANVAANIRDALTQATAAAQSGAVGLGQIPDVSLAASQLGIPANSPFLKALRAIYADPSIQSAAANNLYSSTAQALNTQQTGLANNVDALAKRGGMQQSSDLGILDKLTNNTYGQNNQANILSYLTGVQHAFNTYTGAVQNGKNTLANTGTKVASQVAAANPAIPGTGFLGSMPHVAFNGLNIPGAKVAAPPTGAMGSHGGPL